MHGSKIELSLCYLCIISFVFTTNKWSVMIYRWTFFFLIRIYCTKSMALVKLSTFLRWPCGFFMKVSFYVIFSPKDKSVTPMGDPIFSQFLGSIGKMDCKFTFKYPLTKSNFPTLKSTTAKTLTFSICLQQKQVWTAGSMNSPLKKHCHLSHPSLCARRPTSIGVFYWRWQEKKEKWTKLKGGISKFDCFP